MPLHQIINLTKLNASRRMPLSLFCNIAFCTKAALSQWQCRQKIITKVEGHEMLIKTEEESPSWGK